MISYEIPPAYVPKYVDASFAASFSDENCVPCKFTPAAFRFKSLAAFSVIAVAGIESKHFLNSDIF